MKPTIIPRSHVAERLAVTETLLIRYEAQGLVQVARDEATEGYEPTEVRRIWTIVSLQRDLGVNIAGVEAILRLRAQYDHLHRRMQALADDLRDALDGATDLGPEDAG